MKYFTLTDPELRVDGLPGFNTDKKLCRLPESVMALGNDNIRLHGCLPVGGRVRFRTDSIRYTVQVVWDTLAVDRGMPLIGSAGIDVWEGQNEDSCATADTARFITTLAPPDYHTRQVEVVLDKAEGMRDIMLHLPRNERVAQIIIGIENGARIETPLAYTVNPPIIYYGSSITGGGCASRVSNAYTALVNRWLNADYINFGFSGSARGEKFLAEYFSTLSMSAFVLDYDHNAPTPEELQATHEAFFRVIRQAQPKLPILIMTRPDFENDWQSDQRRAVIRATYNHAVQKGDTHVWFLDGELFFGRENRHACTVDGCHPTDLGFMRMAQTVYPVLKEMLQLDCAVRKPF